MRKRKRQENEGRDPSSHRTAAQDGRKASPGRQEKSQTLEGWDVLSLKERKRIGILD